MKITVQKNHLGHQILHVTFCRSVVPPKKRRLTYKMGEIFVYFDVPVFFGVTFFVFFIFSDFSKFLKTASSMGSIGLKFSIFSSSESSDNFFLRKLTASATVSRFGIADLTLVASSRGSFEHIELTSS